MEFGVSSFFDLVEQCGAPIAIAIVCGWFLMQAIELVKAGTKEPNSQAMQDVVKYCTSKGVLILTA